MWVDILLESTVVDRRTRCDDRVKREDIAIFPEGLSGESREETEEHLLECEDEVLKEEVVHEIRCALIIPTAVHEQQSPKVTELPK